MIAGTTYTSGTAYDAFSRPTTLTYPTSFQVKNVYGTNGYLTDIKSPDNTKTYWTAREYDADGHITEEQYGNGTITDRVYIPENGLLKKITSGIGLSTNVQNLDYRFDVLGNLKKRTDNNQTIGGATLTETFNYDALNRLSNSQATGQAQKAFGYDLLGNISSKADVGTYTYDSLHKHAVRSVNGGTAAVYDANGNMTSGFGRTITWTWFNMPERIQNANASSYFTYDPDHNRITQRNVGQNGLVVTTYVGGFFESVDKDNEVESRHYISSPTGRVAVYAKHQNKQTYAVTYDTKYLHKDHLGSVDVVTNESGAVIERDSFDAWGFRRRTDWQAPQPSTYRSTVSRGFTDHEELDDFGLVHMNGRIYDPGIGRFLSADPFVQFPFVTQNFNRYSYVLNNPLSFTDPSGFGLFSSIFSAIGGPLLGAIGGLIDVALGESWTQFVNGLITSVAASVAYLALAPIPVVGPILAAFGAGFTAGFTSTMLSGASLGQAFQAGAIGGGIAAATVGILKYGIPTLTNALNPSATVATTTAEVDPTNGNLQFGFVSANSSAGPVANSSASLDDIPVAVTYDGTVGVHVVGTATGSYAYYINPSTAGHIGAVVGGFASDFLHGVRDGFISGLRSYIFSPTDGTSRVMIGNRNTNFFENWAMGNQPSRINYAPNSPETLDMHQSPGAARMRADFYASGAQSSRTGYSTPRAYLETIVDPRTARLHSTALQVGGFDRATVVNNGDGTATFTITNVAGAHSLFFHAVPNSPFTWGPMHNVTQTFTWTEPIGP